MDVKVLNPISLPVNLSSFIVLTSVTAEGYEGSKERPDLEKEIADQFRDGLTGWAGSDVGQEADEAALKLFLAESLDDPTKSAVLPDALIPSGEGHPRLVLWAEFKVKTGAYKTYSKVGDVIVGMRNFPLDDFHRYSGDRVRLTWLLVLPDGRLAMVGHLKDDKVENIEVFCSKAAEKIKNKCGFK